MKATVVPFNTAREEWIKDQFTLYNAENNYQENREVFCVELTDEANKCVGLLRGVTNNNWMHIHELIILSELRKNGLGSKLLLAAEDFARNHNLHGITLNTLGFQALKFYQKFGYEEFGRLEKFGYTEKIYLRKYLRI